MTGVELRISGVGSDHSINWATTLPMLKFVFDIIFKQLKMGLVVSVTRLGDLLDFGQLFKAFGNN